MPPGTPLLPGPTADQLVELNRLHQQGLYLDAFRLCEQLPPLTQWQGAPALVLAGRLAQRWGDAPLSNRLHVQAYRTDPTDWLARYYHLYTRWSRHGTFEALRLTAEGVQSLPLVPTNREQAYFWLLHARLLCSFRDFTAAEAISRRVLAHFAHDPWVWVDQADLLENQDRYPEAMEAAEEALRRQPWYVPAVMSKAHLLQLQQRDDEAATLLRSALQHVQSGILVKMLVGLCEEAGRLDEIPALLDLAGTYLPTPDQADKLWLAGRRCMVAYRAGDHPLALQWAKTAAPHSAYYRKIADHLAAPNPAGRRVHLSVGFVRQHHMTCAPATLAALSNFWNRPADHLEIARLICYNGTPGHLEREWARKEGWLVREFRLDWDTARALLDRGCPFSVVTVEAESAHMQAVIGYDSVLETLLVRDPFERQFRDWRAPEFFTAYAAHGPRAMLLLPGAEAERIAGLELPDAPLYDQVHAFRLALESHDRAAAETAVSELQRLGNTHLLTHWSRYDLALYDGRLSAALVEIQAIRLLYPENDGWRLAELRLRERLGNPAEHRRLLEELGGTLSAFGVFRREYAEELVRDARSHRRAEHMLRCLLRRQALDPKTLRAYANLLWARQDFSAAAQVYRLAACRAEKTEYHWDSYFIATRYLNQSAEALALLQSRVERWGSSSSQPARTLFDSLNAVDRTPEAFKVLEQARTLRPNDGELLLFSAEALMRYGRRDEAAELLAAARSRESRATWLRSAARMADVQRDHRQALEHWRELVTLQPTDAAIYTAIARLIHVTEGSTAAATYLQQACREHPHQLPLHQTLVIRLRDHRAEEALEAVNRMLALDPADAWTWREKALVLRRLRRYGEALECADHAMLIAPQAPSSHSVRGDVLASLDRRPEAHAEYREGIQLSIDADWLFEPLLDTCPDFAARSEAVRFIHAELMRQPSLNNAVLQFRVIARVVVSAAELAQMLRDYHAAWPDNWSAWSALAQHALESGELDGALTLAQSATERFPLVPRAWLDLAQVQARQGATAAEIASIEKALAINPAWSHASRQLSSAHERQLRLDAAEHVMRRAVAAEPTDAANHNWLAHILWRRRSPAEAMAAIETSLSFNPNSTWAWERLHEWGRETGDPGRAERLARTLTETRAGEAEVWLQLVRLRFNEPDLAANLAALDRAAELDPCAVGGWDLRAQLLAQHHRYDEALASCRPAALGDPPPWNLRGRAAWIESCRGRIDAAIEQTALLVQEHPDYRWGWIRLTEWYWEKKQYPEVRRCAEKWAWLDQGNAAPHGYLAIVHLEEKRRAEAKAALARSIEIDPLYGYGATELLKLHLADSEFDAARRVLQHYATHFSPAESLRAEMRLHLAVKDRDAATATLRKIAVLTGSAADAFAQTVNQLLDAGWSNTVEKALEPLLGDPSALPETGEHWVTARRRQQLAWTTLGKVLWAKPTPSQRAQMLGAYVSWLGEEKHRARLWLACLIWRRELHDDPGNWGQTGYALVTAGRFRAGARWMRDWASRPTPPAGWMLHNLVLALQTLGRPAQALTVIEGALRLPADHLYEKLLLWRANAHALSGETAAARHLLDKINPGKLPRFYQSLLTLTRLLVDTQEAPPAQRKQAANDALARLEQERAEYPSVAADRALRRIYRRVLDQLGREARRPWQRVRSRLPLFAPSSNTASVVANGNGNVPFWALWLIFAFLSAAVRTCSALP